MTLIEVHIIPFYAPVLFVPANLVRKKRCTGRHRTPSKYCLTDPHALSLTIVVVAATVLTSFSTWIFVPFPVPISLRRYNISP